MVNALSHTSEELIVLHFKFRIHHFQAFILRCAARTVRHLIVRLFIAQTRSLRHAARSSGCSRLDITIDGRVEEEPVSISKPALSRLLTRGPLKILLTSCPRFKTWTYPHKQGIPFSNYEQAEFSFQARRISVMDH